VTLVAGYSGAKVGVAARDGGEVPTERAGSERRLTMRLGWRDGSASLFVIAAEVLYGLWQRGTAL
jgi:hypothetical protein